MKVTLVFDDGIKRLARVIDVENRRLSWSRINWQCGTTSPGDYRIWISQGRQAGVYYSESNQLGASQIWALQIGQ